MTITNLLAVETSAHTCSVALQVATETYTAVETTERQHTRQLLPQISQLLRDAGITLRQLDAIAFSCGPGSFTGIRLAASVVQGLAFGANLPIIPISTLQVLAQDAYTELSVNRVPALPCTPGTAVIVVTDAHGGNVYWGGYQLGQDYIMHSLLPDQHSAPDQVALPHDMTAIKWIATGDGWAKYQDQLRLLTGITYLPGCYPKANEVLTLAKFAYTQGNYSPAEQAIPVYLYGADRWRKQP